MPASGGCLCGAVRYEVKERPTEAGACHCGMCRKWSGGIYMAFRVPGEEVRLKGEEHIGRYKSSDWAERCFCKKCGSSLFYRVTLEGTYFDNHHIGFGTLDDQSGIPLTSEIYVDRKPEGYAFEGDHPRLTEAEILAMYGGG